MTAVRIHHTRELREGQFVGVPNETARDKRLTWAARGYLAEQLSNKPDWSAETSERAAARARRERGDDAESARQVRLILAELERCGYRHRVRRRGEGREFVNEAHYYDRPTVPCEDALTCASCPKPSVSAGRADPSDMSTPPDQGKQGVSAGRAESTLSDPSERGPLRKWGGHSEDQQISEDQQVFEDKKPSSSRGVYARAAAAESLTQETYATVLDMLRAEGKSNPEGYVITAIEGGYLDRLIAKATADEEPTDWIADMEDRTRGQWNGRVPQVIDQTPFIQEHPPVPGPRTCNQCGELPHPGRPCNCSSCGQPWRLGHRCQRSPFVYPPPAAEEPFVYDQPPASPYPEEDQ